MTKVLIDRELLEHMRNFTVMHDSGVAGVLRGQIDAILAQPAQQGEAVEVVAYVTTGFSGGPRSRRAFTVTEADANQQHENWVPHYQKVTTDELMTVAQHQRFLADYATLEAENAALKQRCGMFGLELENAEERQIQAERQVAILRQHKTDYMEAAEGTRKALEAECKRLRKEKSARQALSIQLIDEARALRAELAAIKGQEPVCEVSEETFSSDRTSDIITCNLPIGTKLYTLPAAPEGGEG